MIYIQSNLERTLPYFFDAACALYGAIDSGQEYRLTTLEEVKGGKFDNLIKRNLFVGSVEFMTEVFSRIGISNVKVPRNSNRSCEIITLEEAFKRTLDGSKLFIKPVEIKLFTGLILDGCKYSCLESLDKNVKVMAYDVFNSPIISEWRLYILNKKIVDAHCYSGNFKISPDYSYVRHVLKQNNEDFPVSYTIDIAILESTEEVVVEFNDMWAIGNYGVPNDLYLKMLKERYYEITGLYKNF